MHRWYLGFLELICYKNSINMPDRSWHNKYEYIESGSSSYHHIAVIDPVQRLSGFITEVRKSFSDSFLAWKLLGINKMRFDYGDKRSS